MSKPYRIRLQETVSVTDSSTFHIDPVPLVGASEFTAILQAVLQEAGWSATSDGKMQMQGPSREGWIFDPKTMQITTELQAAEAIDQDFSGWSQENLHDQAAKHKEATAKRLQAEAAAKLDARQEDRKQTFEQLVVEATGRAIKHAAGRLGDIHDIQESRGEDGRYALTITIHEKD